MAEKQTIIRIKVEGTSDMAKLKQQIVATEESLKATKTAYKNGAISQKEYAQAATNTETKLKTLKGEFNQQQKEVIATNNTMKKAKGSYASLAAENKKLSVQVRNLSDPLGKNRQEFDKLSGKISENTNKMKLMDESMGRYHKNVGNYSLGLQGFATKIGGVMIAVQGAIMAFKQAERVIGVFVDFEFAMKQVGAIAQATEEEFIMLEESARELGSTTAFTATEVAGLQKELAKLGFDPTEIVNMTSSVLDLSFAFGEDLTFTAEQAGIALNMFGLDATETSRVTDVMAVAFQNSALDAQKLSNALPKVGAVAKTMGFSLEDTVALLAKLSDAGFDASTAGTSLRNIFLKMADPAGELAQQLGRSITSVDELAPALEELSEKGVDVADALEMTDKRSAAAFLTLIQSGEGLEELTGKLYNAEGATSDLADTMRDSLKGQLDELKSAAEGAAIDLMDQLRPAISAIISGLSFLFENIGKVTKVLAPFIAAWASYRILQKAVTIGQAAYTAALTAGQFVIDVVTKKQKLFNKAALANPYLAIAAAIIAVYTAMQTWASQMTVTEESAARINDIRAEAVGTTINEAAALDSLLETARDVTKSDKERQEAIDALNGSVSSYNGELSLSNVMTQEAVDLLNKHKEAMVANAMVAGLKTELEAKVAEQFKESNKSLDEYMNTWDYADMALESNIGLLGLVYNGYNQLSAGTTAYDRILERTAKRQNEAVADLQVWIDKLTEEIQLQQERATAANEVTLEMITANNVYNNSLVGQKQKLSDLMKVRDSALRGSELWNDAQKEVIKQQKKVNEMEEEAEIVIKKHKNAYEQLGETTKNLTTDLQLYLLSNKDITAENWEQFASELALKTITDEYTTALKDQQRIQEVIKAIKESIIKGNNENADSTENETDKLEKQLKVQSDYVKMLETVQAKIKEYNIEVNDLDLSEAENSIKSFENISKSAAVEIVNGKMSVLQTSLKIAEAELITAINAGTASEEMITKVEEIKASLEMYQEYLRINKDTTGDTDGFLKRKIFGVKDGEEDVPFTGEDLIASVQLAFDAAAQAMDGFSQIMTNQMNEKIGVIERERDAAVQLFLDSAEAETMTEEEKAAKILDIEEKFDDDILKLEQDNFKKQQKFQYAQIAMNTAAAIMQIWAQPAVGEFFTTTAAKWIQTGLITGLGAIQAAVVASQQMPTGELGGVVGQTFADGGMVVGPSHADGGVKFRVGNEVIELEGGEAVINKESTAAFRPILSKINELGGGRKFAQGGITMDGPILDQIFGSDWAERRDTGPQEVIVTEAEITSTQETVSVLESRASF